MTIVDEQRYTNWAIPGQWTAWNPHSPEVEVVDFVGRLIFELEPNVIAETGCGQGYFCRALPQRALHFESNPKFRPDYADQEQQSPRLGHYRKIDFLILDSDSPWREREIVWWWWLGKPGSWCFIHDTGNGHGHDIYHSILGGLVAQLAMPGWFFGNPRGSWLGVHP